MAAFVAWELRAPHPMLPMRFFRSRTFAAANGVGFVMSFGVFGSIFLLAPFLQVTQGLSPLEAGIRTLPWTAMPMLVAPWAGILSDRIGSRPLMATGLALQAGALAWLASISVPDVAYSSLVIPFAMAGAGMALVFAPSANAVLGSVDQRSAGQASGATNAIRELGGVMGIAVLASVFSAHGSYASPQAYTDGMVSAVWVGAAVLAAGALVALLIPRVAGRAGRPARRPRPAADPGGRRSQCRRLEVDRAQRERAARVVLARGRGQERHQLRHLGGAGRGSGEDRHGPHREARPLDAERARHVLQAGARSLRLRAPGPRRDQHDQPAAVVDHRARARPAGPSARRRRAPPARPRSRRAVEDEHVGRAVERDLLARGVDGPLRHRGAQRRRALAHRRAQLPRSRHARLRAREHAVAQDQAGAAFLRPARSARRSSRTRLTTPARPSASSSA